jgi:[acyl-carrier-protein] S-malonyltransferase
MSAVAFLFPGQGSQYVGMGKSFYDAYPSVRRLFEEASELVEQDLRTLCFAGPAETLVRTENVQPAITLVDLAVLQVLREEGVSPAAAAGHSLGEYAALCAAGVFSFADAIRLVQFRGAVMQRAADRHPGGMLAVFGLDLESVSAVCEEARVAGSVEVANHNSPRQVVVTGQAEALKHAGELAKKRGAKLLVPLKVSGPWHSRFMAEAREELQARLAETTLAPPSFPVVANVTGDVYPSDPDEIRRRLVDQVVSAVLWAGSVGRLVELGNTLFLEVGPGKALTGLMRDIARGVPALNVQDTAGLEKVRALQGTQGSP